MAVWYIGWEELKGRRGWARKERPCGHTEGKSKAQGSGERMKQTAALDDSGVAWHGLARLLDPFQSWLYTFTSVFPSASGAACRDPAVFITL